MRPVEPRIAANASPGRLPPPGIVSGAPQSVAGRKLKRRAYVAVMNLERHARARAIADVESLEEEGTAGAGRIHPDRVPDAHAQPQWGLELVAQARDLKCIDPAPEPRANRDRGGNAKSRGIEPGSRRGQWADGNARRETGACQTDGDRPGERGDAEDETREYPDRHARLSRSIHAGY